MTPYRGSLYNEKFSLYDKMLGMFSGRRSIVVRCASFCAPGLLALWWSFRCTCHLDHRARNCRVVGSPPSGRKRKPRIMLPQPGYGTWWNRWHRRSDAHAGTFAHSPLPSLLHELKTCFRRKGANHEDDVSLVGSGPERTLVSGLSSSSGHVRAAKCSTGRYECLSRHIDQCRSRHVRVWWSIWRHQCEW